MDSLVDNRTKILSLKAISLQIPIKVIISSLILLNTNFLFAYEKIDDSNIEKILIKDLHPDMNNGKRDDEERMTEVVWAWEQINKSIRFKD